jgi:trk system potassium uptake protein TrkH
MRAKITLNFIGKVLIGMAVLFTFPIFTALIYHENILNFVIPQVISLIVGLLLNAIKYEKNSQIYARDGLKIVALSWIIISLIGALPIYLNHDAPYIDALFETVSGFTTTGATIFKDVEHLDKAILFWRGFTHFIGGMGVLAFVMAIIPLSTKNKSMHVLKAEMPGPSVSKLVPSMKKSLAILYGIYIGLTVLEIALLKIAHMPTFDSIVIAFGTAGTGGFSVLNTSIASYTTMAKYVIAIFMFLFGVNFNIYFLVALGKVKEALKSEELKVYASMFIVAVAIVVLNTVHIFGNTYKAFEEAFFHVSSIMTSTGYAIGDINVYPSTSRVVMLVLMLISACAGSTCGGLKISRLIICAKSIKRNLIKQVHPNAVQVVKFEGKKVSEETIENTNTFIFLYVALILLFILIISFNGYNIETTINAVFTTFANVGLCFNIQNFQEFTVLSKATLCVAMLLGRLEIFPLVSLISDMRKE